METSTRLKGIIIFIQQDDEMRDTKWTPNYSHYNTYNKTSYSSKKIDYLDDTTKL